MIRLHCTKKLSAKLPLLDNRRIKSSRPSPYASNDSSEVSALGDWHANLLVLQRRQCVLFVHDATRFAVFVPALQKADFAELDHRFADSFMNTLLKVDADDDMMKRANGLLGPLICDNVCNRSVQGNMNQMAQEIAIMLDRNGISVADITGYSVGAGLAHRPTSGKGIKSAIWPDKAMRELLSTHAKGVSE